VSVLGNWRFVEMTMHTNGDPDRAKPANIRFEGHRGGQRQPKNPLGGQICFQGADEANFITRREASSTAC
jgi:hypothetical protein